MEQSDCHTAKKGCTEICPACGAAFECRMSEECWCASINLPPDVREYLADHYESCLCRNCLETMIKKAEAGRLA